MNPDRLNTDDVERRPSSKTSRAIVLAFAGSLLAIPAWAQGTQSDSLAARLRRAEAAIAALQQQMAEQSESGVKTRSGARMEISGRVAVNAFGNSRRVNNVDDPQFVQPDPAPGVPMRGVGMAIRQTRLGIAVSGVNTLNGAFTGDVDVDFYGGQQASSGGRTFPLLRIRTARGIVRWANADLLIGQESPLVSGLNPVTPAAIGTPEFATAGNLWLWLPQVRFGVHSSGRIQFGAQAAVLAPTSGDAVAGFDTDYDLAERSQRPYLQGRLSARWGEGETVREVGCGYHQGWLVLTTTRVSSNAVACDLLLPMTEKLELRGEAFTGQALRGLGGGGIGQNVIVSSNAPLKTKGGWAQLNFRPATGFRVGLGCGTDQPERGALRLRNDACSTYAIVRPGGGPIFFGAEMRRIRTSYAASARYTSDHVTITTGFEF